MANCEICGSKLTKKLSFKVKGLPFDNRYTLICNCGFSTIVEHKHEQMTRLGKVRTTTN